MTKKLFNLNSYQVEFTAAVLDTKSVVNGVEVILDQTCFYPTSGGQPFDQGLLNNYEVIDVYERDDKIIHLIGDRTFHVNNDTVSGKIDWQRRFDHMQQHTGQHLLSETFIRLYEAPTFSFHLGVDYCTIDVPLKYLYDEMLKKIEAYCAVIVNEARPIKVHYLTRDQIGSYPLRKNPPDNVTEVRLVEIDSFDYSPCSGTHVNTTAALNLIKIIGYEKIKEGLRIKFLCGNRAIQDYSQKHNLLIQIANEMTCSWPEVSTIWQKSVQERKDLRKKIKQVKNDLITQLANQMISEAEYVNNFAFMTHICQDFDMEDLSILARLLIQERAAYALLMGVSDKVYLIFCHSPNLPGNMGVFMRDACQLLDGKGGGKPEFAQGSGTNVAATSEVMRVISEKILAEIS